MIKNKLNLNYNQIKNLLEKYELETLESFDVLLNCVEDYYDLEETNNAYINVYRKKYLENIEEFEGRNEYLSYGMQVNNFDITEMIDKIDELNEEELIYLNTMVNQALKCTKPDAIEAKVLPKLLEFKNVQEAKTQKKGLPTIDGLDEKDIEKLFNKYNVVELEVFLSILEYVIDYDTTQIAKIINKVYKEKYELLQSNYEVGVKPTGFKLSDLGKVNELLSEDELEFIHTMIENASMYLESIQSSEDEIKEIFEEFDSGDYPVLEMSNFLDSIEQEQEERKNYPLRKPTLNPNKNQNQKQKQKTKKKTI